MKAKVSKKDAAAVSDGTISLFYRKDGGKEKVLKKGLTPSAGKVTYEWEPEETGYYDLAAVYTAPGGGAATGIDDSRGAGAQPSAAGLTETPDGEGAGTAGNTPEGETADTVGNMPESGANAASGTDGEDSPLAVSAVNGQHIAVSEPVSLHVGTIRDEVYVIRYELNGGGNNAKNLSAIGRNAVPRVLAEPTRVGAEFEGWYEDAGFTKKVEALDPEHIGNAIGGKGGPYVLYAKWKAAGYNVTYKLDGGTNHPDNPDKYTLLDGITLCDPEKTGYRFMGWYFESSSQPGVDVDKSMAVYSLPLLDKKGGWVAADLTLRAKWEAIEYPITYHIMLATGKGENPDRYTVEDKVELKEADYTGRYGFEPAGWYTDREFKEPIDRIGTGRTGPLDLYAKQNFTSSFVWFDAMGGVYRGQNPMNIPDSSGGIELGSAERQGFELKFWSEEAVMVDGEWVADLSDSGKLHYAGSPFKPEKNFYTLHAVWNPLPGQVEIQWLNPVDGEEIARNYGVKGENIEDPNYTPSCYGYAFDGKWYKDKELTKQWNFDNDVVPADTGDTFTLYAGFRKAYYTVAFEPNGGSAVPEKQVQEGKAVVKPKDPVKQNEILLGWYEDDALTMPYNFASELQNDITLYAKWRGRGPIKSDPGDNKILGIEDGRTYAIGSVLDFTAAGTGMDNNFPIENDERYVPKSWSVNPSGTWSAAPYAASFDTKDMTLGKHKLTVTFGLERYEDGDWKEKDNRTKTEISFVLAEDVPEPGGEPSHGGKPGDASSIYGGKPGDASSMHGGKPGDASRTGDENDPWLWVLLATAALMGGGVLVIVKRRGRKKRR